jgi:hypothetical protein
MNVLTRLAKLAIRAFERRWSYDASYMHEIVDGAGVGAILPLQALAKVSRYRRGLPASVYYAATITAVIAADCGSCAQLTVRMAQAEGVPSDLLRALAAGAREELGADDRLGFDLARATLARQPCADVRAAILARWGRRGLVSLAYGLVAAEAFPTLKYALGHGYECARLSIA